MIAPSDIPDRYCSRDIHSYDNPDNPGSDAGMFAIRAERSSDKGLLHENSHDSFMGKSINHWSIIQGHVNDFASAGLRALVMGHHVFSDPAASNSSSAISSDEDKKLNEWLGRYRLNEQQIDMNTYQNGLNKLINELESDMVIVGASAVRDRLQSGVYIYT